MPFFETPVQKMARLGARFREQRMHLNLTIEMLAEATGLAPPTIQRFETSGRGTIATMIRLMEALRLGDDFDLFLNKAPVLDVDGVLKAQKQRRRVRPGLPR